MLVRCRNAAGSARELYIRHARSANQAIREALRILESDHPGQGWRAEWAL